MSFINFFSKTKKVVVNVTRETPCNICTLILIVRFPSIPYNLLSVTLSPENLSTVASKTELVPDKLLSKADLGLLQHPRWSAL